MRRSDRFRPILSPLLLLLATTCSAESLQLVCATDATNTVNVARSSDSVFSIAQISMPERACQDKIWRSKAFLPGKFLQEGNSFHILAPAESAIFSVLLERDAGQQETIRVLRGKLDQQSAQVDQLRQELSEFRRMIETWRAIEPYAPDSAPSK